MKNLNKISLIGAILLLSFVFTSDTYAGDWLNWFKKNKNNTGNPGTPVGAPIDGGLLTILGAAGVGYFLMRKKNSKENK
jgi:hypothetical protein